MARWANSRTRMSALAAMMVMVLMSSTHFSAAVEYDQWSIGGREFTITNIPPLDPNPYCPDSTTNTATFYPSSDDPLKGTLLVVGDFEGLDTGACTGTVYGIAPGTILTYAIYGDLMIVQFPDRVPSGVKIVFQQGKLYFIGLNQSYYISILTDNGPAPGPAP